MLYVFHVDRGSMMTLEMNLALSSVQNLKQVIYEKTGIILEKQVLLISGGEPLMDTEDVCHYSAGTDTNPIFLFSLMALDRDHEYIEDPEIRIMDLDMKKQVEASLQMPANHDTVLARAHLSQIIYENSRQQLVGSEESVMHQHLQQQGWAAVVASLEDILTAFCKNFNIFERNFLEFSKIRESSLEILEKFDEDLYLLRKIPLLPALQSSGRSVVTCSESTAQHDPQASIPGLGAPDLCPGESVRTPSSKKTLLDYIDGGNMDLWLENMKDKLSKFDMRLLKQLQREYTAIASEGFDKPEMKEIQGLGERLSRLDSLMRDGMKYVDEQKILAESFYHNKTRSGSVKDESVYPNLCQSQTHYMKQMHINYTKISDIHKRCLRAKSELSANIVRRLTWIVFLEVKVTELNSRLSMTESNFKRIENELRIFEQIHHAPRIYFSAIAEVVRRQIFSKHFLQWANRLSGESHEIWEREVQTRRKFSPQLSTHFLLSLFPGLNDIPPAFATEKPRDFDEFLPQLSPDTVEFLRSTVPELAHLLVIEESGAVPPMIETALRSNENTNTLTPSSNGREIASGEMFASAATSPLRGSPRTSPEKGEELAKTSDSEDCCNTSRPSSFIRDQPESETDTEEFEKVCGSISEGTYSPMETVPDPCKVSKTRHQSPHFQCQSGSDSKHIKLDPSSSHQTDATSGPLTPSRAGGEGLPENKGISPTLCDCTLLSPGSQGSQEEFASPDFYIDESMPSSYTESTGTTTTTSSTGACRHHHTPQHHRHHHHTHTTGSHVKSHHVITAELQKQIEEKNLGLLALQNELGNSRAEVEALQTRLRSLAKLDCETVVHDLRKEMHLLKDQVRDDGTSYLEYISELSSRLLEILKKVQTETEASQELAVQAAVSSAQSEEVERRTNLTAQLMDTHRELEMYQEQTRAHITKIERLKYELEEERSRLTSEKEESIKKLTLEHELEMEALKEQWHDGDKERANEVTLLSERITNLESELAKLEREKESLSGDLEERFKAKYKEKEESIYQILGASYSEREKKNLEAQQLALTQEFEAQKTRLLEEHETMLNSKLEELQVKLEADFQERLSKELKEGEERHSEELTRCRDLWDAQKEEEVEVMREEIKAGLQSEFETKLESARVQYKMDLEGLRSRFRMMTTASMDKSPSETSLEKFERGDWVESSFHETEISKLREQLQEEKEKALDEMKKGLEEAQQGLLEEERARNAEDMKRIEAEQREMFNAAFKEVSRDKERVIEDLRLRVEFLTEETDKLRKGGAAPQDGGKEPPKDTLDSEGTELTPEKGDQVRELQEKCESYRKEVDRLEKEVQRAKRLSFVSERHPDMSGSDTSPCPSVASSSGAQSPAELSARLQQENKELKNAIVRTYSDRRKVSLDDAQVYDFVLVVWDDVYSQYRILLEHQNILHFLHSDSYAALGLSKGPDKPEKLFCTAQVTKKKEFCQAKRDGNRFNVPKGTKFYRVEAGPCGLLKEEVEKETTKRESPAVAEPVLEDPSEEGAVGGDEGSTSSS